MTEVSDKSAFGAPPPSSNTTRPLIVPVREPVCASNPLPVFGSLPGPGSLLVGASGCSPFCALETLKPPDTPQTAEPILEKYCLIGSPPIRVMSTSNVIGG